VEFERMPPELVRALSGVGFRRKRRLALPFSTADADGYPRVALLMLGEVRALSPTQLAVAVRAGSRTAVNLIRRRFGTLLLLQRGMVASIQARAGRGRMATCDVERQIFPLTVARVRLDSPAASEGAVQLLSGPTFGGADGDSLFSEELYAELGRAFPTR
jgi:hypothetical protein